MSHLSASVVAVLSIIRNRAISFRVGMADNPSPPWHEVQAVPDGLLPARLATSQVKADPPYADCVEISESTFTKSNFGTVYVFCADGRWGTFHSLPIEDLAFSCGGPKIVQDYKLLDDVPIPGELRTKQIEVKLHPRDVDESGVLRTCYIFAKAQKGKEHSIEVRARLIRSS